MKMHIRIVLSLFALIVFTPSARAQKIDDLVQGARVRVAIGGHSVDGNFQSASPDSIKIVADGGVHLVFPRTDSVAVFRSAGVHRGRSALLVGTTAGILGAIAGAAIGSSSYKPCESKGFYDCSYVPNSKARATVFGGFVFGVPSALIGALVGAAGAGHSWIPVDR
jgi:hypothetical protein